MALPDTSWHYCIVPWRDLVLPDSTRYCCSTWLYLTLLYIKPWLYFILLHCSIALLCTTWFYYILYLALLDSTTLYHGSTWCYYTLLHCTVALYLALLTLYHGSIWLYLTLLQSTVALLDCTMALLRSTWLYYIRHIVRWYNDIKQHVAPREIMRHYETEDINVTQWDIVRPWYFTRLIQYTVAWLYLGLPDSTRLHCIIALHGSTWLYYIVPELALPDYYIVTYHEMI